MTRNPLILAGLCTALFAVPALAQSDAGIPLTAPAASAAQPAATAAIPVKKVPDVRAVHLQAKQKDEALAARQKAVAAKQKDLTAQQRKLAAQQSDLATQQRKLAAERQRIRIASGAVPAGCGNNFAGQKRDAASCRALRQQAMLNRLGPYDRPAVPSVP